MHIFRRHTQREIKFDSIALQHSKLIYINIFSLLHLFRAVPPKERRPHSTPNPHALNIFILLLSDLILANSMLLHLLDSANTMHEILTLPLSLTPAYCFCPLTLPFPLLLPLLLLSLFHYFNSSTTQKNAFN